MENMKKYRLGIALGGGGAKGFAILVCLGHWRNLD